MHRPSVSRLLSALFALWFATVVVDDGVLRACPELGSHSGAHGGQSGHMSHQMAGASHGGPAQAPHGCTCIGSCSAAPALASLPVVATFAVSTTIVGTYALPRFDERAPAARADRLLPFANGPPQA